jgi:hypothetical protein
MLVSPAELDQKPTTTNSLAILNLLLNKSGQSLDGRSLKRQKNIDNIYGRFKKLPTQANLLQGFQKESPTQQLDSNKNQT